MNTQRTWSIQSDLEKKNKFGVADIFMENKQRHKPSALLYDIYNNKLKISCRYKVNTKNAKILGK